ncbi:hypothetical protein OG365_35585 [Streptomyces sp. NBC_00853]|uniref:hypothetical protein n=1 Tax=Streptomyces sp. NBC_00853 TaxID=2903681 RepID=UPI0038734403|nr:hypothetical protein OG365_35585 [Streptomyces sp. NBC_00853]
MIIRGDGVALPGGAQGAAGHRIQRTSGEAAGKSVTTCETYLVPENVQPTFVGFQGDRDNRSPSYETGTAAEVVRKVG